MCYCLTKYKFVFMAITSTTYGQQKLINLVYGRKPSNSIDRYAATVLKDDVVIGHLPRQLPQILSWFIMRNGTIDCIITGGRRCSTDLPQGGIENPHKLLFSGKHEDITKSSAL